MCIRDSCKVLSTLFRGKMNSKSLKNKRIVSVLFVCMGSIQSVSYTHLDVYKRQQEWWRRYEKLTYRTKRTGDSFESIPQHHHRSVGTKIAPLSLLALSRSVSGMSNPASIRKPSNATTLSGVSQAHALALFPCTCYRYAR